MELKGINTFVRLNTNIYRANQIYLEKILKKYDLSSGSYPYLMVLCREGGLSQNKLSCELGYDKAMSARVIARLIDSEYIYKLNDENDSRAYKLYLTEKAIQIIPLIKKEIQTLINLITEGLSEEDKNVTTKALEVILNNIRNLNHKE